MEVGSLNIRMIVDSITRGQIRIPAFQRGFVWEPERIAHLMDSIYKKYPFGSILLWRTREQLAVERDLGPFALPAPVKDYPVDYVLDGQQRITSIFGVFQSALAKKGGSDWPEIYFDLSSDDHPQSTQFFSLDSTDVDEEIHFPIRALFDTVEYRKATSVFDVKTIARIDELQSIFKEAAIPYQLVETDEKAKVAIIFERVNTQGVELDTLQLLTAWTWSEDFQLHEQFKDLSEELAPFGFAGLGADSTLLLRCCSAILAESAAPDALMEMKGSTVRDKFPQIVNGVKGAIDFLRSQFKLESLLNLPYPAMIVPLSVFFAAEDGKEVSYNDAQRQAICKWFWRTAFSRRYSSGFPRNILTDIQEMKKCRDRQAHSLGDIFVDNSVQQFIYNTFRIGSVNTNTFILMLASRQPESFISGAKLNLADKLKSANREEFHHLMPKAFLRSTGIDYKVSENCLANFCFLSRADNRALGGAAPSVYKSKLPADHGHILEAAICPEQPWSDDFSKFVIQRGRMLADYADKLCEIEEITPSL